MPTHKTQLGWLQTALSIIELDFSTPFTKDGPPESISNLWVEFLKRLEEDEVVDWITWGHDVGTLNKVCVLVGWKRHVLFTAQNFKLPYLAQVEVAQAAVATMKRHVILSFIFIAPFLATPPTILNTINSGDHYNYPSPHAYRNPWRRDCDLILVDTPLLGPIYETVNAELEELQQHCRVATLQGVNEKGGDLSRCAFGIDESVDGRSLNPVSGTCTFIIFIYWQGPEEMARFKNPTGSSFAAGNRELDADCWSVEILNRLARFRETGALVRVETRFSLARFRTVVDCASSAGFAAWDN